MKSEVGFCFKIFKEWYQENRENTYLALKYPSFCGPKVGPRPHAKKGSLAKKCILECSKNKDLFTFLMKSEVGFCFKIFKEWYQENRENTYLALKYLSFWCPKWAPDPMPKTAHFARTTLLCTIGNLGLSRSGAPHPDQILDPPLSISLHNFALR